MEGHEKGRLVRVERFKLDVREPYMGNMVPLSIYVTTYYRSGFYCTVEVSVPEDCKRRAEPVEPEDV